MNDSVPFDPVDEEEIYQESPRWYDRWRERIHIWVSEHTHESVGDVLLLVPDMFMLMLRLVRDNRVPAMAKGQLLVALAYVLNPFDFIPEAVAGVVGLSDDAGVMALVLMWINNVLKLDRDIIRENWSGKSDPADVIEEVHEAVMSYAEEWYGSKLWQRIRRRFNRERADGMTIEHETYEKDGKIYTRVPIS